MSGKLHFFHSKNALKIKKKKKSQYAQVSFSNKLQEISLGYKQHLFKISYTCHDKIPTFQSQNLSSVFGIAGDV